MNIKSLNNLQKDGQAFNLYVQVLVNGKAYSVYNFTCVDKHSMRIDLVCFDIYQSTDNIDILTNINGIINPLAIKSGDVLYYVDQDDIEDVRSDEAVFSAILNSVKSANKGKEMKLDKNRQKDVNKRNEIEKAKSYIPPNIVETSNVETNNGKIILRPNF